MKLHDYKCLCCGHHFVDEAVNAPDCPICGSDETAMDCNIAIHGNYRHPVHSDALAIHPSQRKEHKEQFPNIELDGQCRPIFNNFVDHQAYLDQCNIVCLPPKKKSLGRKRIATMGKKINSRI